MSWLGDVWDSVKDTGKSLLGVSASENAQEATDTQRSAVNMQNKVAQQQLDWGAEDRNRYKSVFQPLENAYVSEAQNFDSPERYAEEAGKAQGNVMQQYGMAMDRLRRSQGPAADLSAARLALASAAAGANAQNSARMSLRDAAWARKTDALSLGKGMPAQASSALAGAAANLGSVSANAGYMANAAYNRANQAAYNAGQFGLDVYRGMNGNTTSNGTSSGGSNGSVVGGIGSALGSAMSDGISSAGLAIFGL